MKCMGVGKKNWGWRKQLGKKLGFVEETNPKRGRGERERESEARGSRFHTYIFLISLVCALFFIACEYHFDLCANFDFPNLNFIPNSTYPKFPNPTARFNSLPFFFVIVLVLNWFVNSEVLWLIWRIGIESFLGFSRFLVFVLQSIDFGVIVKF